MPPTIRNQFLLTWEYLVEETSNSTAYMTSISPFKAHLMTSPTTGVMKGVSLNPKCA